jgi:hypothetical protein
MSEEQNKCCECGKAVDTEQEYYWSHTKEDYLCLGCYESDSNHVTTVQIVEDGEVTQYLIGDHIRMTEYGDDLYGTNLTFDRKWVSSDGWRGHYETTIQGWEEVLTGWTTGGWDDPIARKKVTFNEWANAVLTGEIVPPVPVAVVADPTSNVFSMGIGVLTPNPSALKEWLDEDFNDLEEALS